MFVQSWTNNTFLRIIEHDGQHLQQLLTPGVSLSDVVRGSSSQQGCRFAAAGDYQTGGGMLEEGTSVPESRIVSKVAAVHYPQVPFERYADDVIAHCKTEKEAQEMRKAMAERLQTCGLELHPEKTKIVYCKDDFRKGKNYPNETVDFLGYSFQPRRSKNRKGKFFINFSPAVSNQAAKAIRDTFRRWNLPNRSDRAIEDLSQMFNPIIRGWLQYYGRYWATTDESGRLQPAFSAADCKTFL